MTTQFCHNKESKKERDTAAVIKTKRVADEVKRLTITPSEEERKKR